MAKSHLKLVTPATVNRTVRLKRPPNSELRTREYLTETEVERLMKAATRNRWGQRDATMVLVAYRHGLRSSELVDLRWDQIEFASGTLHVRRVKQGTPSTHPILGDELRALRRLKREQEPKSPFVFTSERGAPFSTAGFARMVERAGKEAKLAFKPRRYFRRPGFKLVRLPGPPGSQEFMEAYQSALESGVRVQIGVARSTPGTVSALIGILSPVSLTNLKSFNRPI